MTHLTTLDDTTPARRARHPFVAAVLAVAVALALVACGGSADGDADGGIEDPTFEYVIPLGSGEKIAQGEFLDILPRELNVVVGETIAIHNEDTIAHSLGPWFVGPGESLRQRFLTVGSYEGTCSVHPAGAFRVVVSQA